MMWRASFTWPCVVACADLAWDDKDPSTDYKVWADW